MCGKIYKPETKEEALRMIKHASVRGVAIKCHRDEWQQGSTIMSLAIKGLQIKSCGSCTTSELGKKQFLNALDKWKPE